MTLKNRYGLLVLFYLVALVALGNTSSTETYVRVAEAESAPLYKTVETLHAEVSAYTSDVAETDEDPFTTANGDTVGEGTIACPSRYKFGTMIQIENRIYKCNDRMNIRYRETNHFDIWFENKKEALIFGRQKLTISIITIDIHSYASK